VTRRANKALVEFDNLLPIEKNYIRHFVFVYPWVSRSAVWSLRAMHGASGKTDVLAHLGEFTRAHDPIFKNAPVWFKRTGYIPIGFKHDGTPKVVNPTSVNTFSTLGDFLALRRGVDDGRQVRIGRRLPRAGTEVPRPCRHGPGRVRQQVPRLAVVGRGEGDTDAGLPQVAAFERGGKFKVSGKTPNVADRSSLETALNANLHATVMSPPAGLTGTARCSRVGSRRAASTWMRSPPATGPTRTRRSGTRTSSTSSTAPSTFKAGC
jgi:hypothetical protein